MASLSPHLCTHTHMHTQVSAVASLSPHPCMHTHMHTQVSAVALLSRCSYLREPIEAAFLSKASLALTRAVYCPKELVPCQHLTFVTRGLVAKLGRIGVTVFGLDMVLEAPLLRDVNPASAVTLAHVSRLSRDSLMGLLVDYPLAAAKVRRVQVRYLVRALVLKAAKLASSHSHLGKWSLETAIAHARELTMPERSLGTELGETPQKRRPEELAPLTAKVDELGASMSRLEQHVDRSLQSMLAELRTALTAMPVAKSKLPKNKSAPPPLPKGGGSSSATASAQQPPSLPPKPRAPAPPQTPPPPVPVDARAQRSPSQSGFLPVAPYQTPPPVPNGPSPTPSLRTDVPAPVATAGLPPSSPQPPPPQERADSSSSLDDAQHSRPPGPQVEGGQPLGEFEA